MTDPMLSIDSDDLEPGTSLMGDRFQISARLGQGGTASVYLAYGEQGRAFALKLIETGPHADAREQRRFRNEMRLAPLLRSIPGVLAPLEGSAVPELQDRHCIVYNYVRGPTLARFIAANRLTVLHACRLGRNIADTLAELHEHGVVHRDVKPGNIIYAQDGTRPRLIEYGFAWSTLTEDTFVPAPGLKHAHKRPGTKRYMAPEQALGKHPAASFDIYALAVTLHEALTGRIPWDGYDDTEILRRKCDPTEPQPSIRSQRRDLPAALAELIDSALRQDPDDRIPTMEVFRDRLDAVLADLGDSLVPMNPAHRPATTGHRVIATKPGAPHHPLPSDDDSPWEGDDASSDGDDGGVPQGHLVHRRAQAVPRYRMTPGDGVVMRPVPRPETTFNPIGPTPDTAHVDEPPAKPTAPLHAVPSLPDPVAVPDDEGDVHDPPEGPSDPTDDESRITAPSPTAARWTRAAPDVAPLQQHEPAPPEEPIDDSGAAFAELSAVPLMTLGTPPLGTPPLAAPAVGTPPLAAPAVATPPLSTPPLSTPAVATPPLDTPALAPPPLSAPPLSTPAVATPPLSEGRRGQAPPLAPLSTPAVATPPLSTPAVATPPLATPALSTPPLDAARPSIPASLPFVGSDGQPRTFTVPMPTLQAPNIQPYTAGARRGRFRWPLWIGSTAMAGAVLGAYLWNTHLTQRTQAEDTHAIATADVPAPLPSPRRTTAPDLTPPPPAPPLPAAVPPAAPQTAPRPQAPPSPASEAAKREDTVALAVRDDAQRVDAKPESASPDRTLPVTSVIASPRPAGASPSLTSASIAPTHRRARAQESSRKVSASESRAELPAPPTVNEEAAPQPETAPPAKAVDCEEIRSEAQNAWIRRDWGSVLRLVRKQNCWPSKAERLRLEVVALDGLKLYHRCVDVGEGSNDLEVLRTVDVCRAKSTP